MSKLYGWPNSEQQGTSNSNNIRFESPPPYSPSNPHQLPPTAPTSPTSSHDEVIPSFNPACQPSIPSLYPAIPQQPQPNHPQVSFPIPQPYSHPTHHSPLYQHQGSQYGTVPPPAGFHTIHIPPHHHHHIQPERRFPFGAILFVFGWFAPPLWILGACCCASSRNPYEAWWARVNLIMVILLVVSSIVYSMLAILTGNWLVGLEWIAIRQEI
ncbi:hypothetical protein BC941DRAFT_439829 [Chlamydoabsidia padenii]|nr:hypothetical protein BC941DRAFT_439829 [Chlamydoabsidia padenii]